MQAFNKDHIQMHNKKWIQSVFVLIMGAISISVQANILPQTIDKKDQPFELKLGASRVIYPADASGATLVVANPQDYPMLVKSQVFAEDKKSTAPFVVTPPLFRLDGQQQNKLSIIRSGGDFPLNRESLQWLCVTGIPPKKGDEWAKSDNKADKPSRATITVQVSVSSCIKLLVRPGSVKGEPTDVASSLTWQRQGAKLKVTNPTPFYINLKSVVLGGKNVENLDYVPPLGSREFTLPSGASGPVEWRIITDLGGDSRIYKGDLQ